MGSSKTPEAPNYEAAVKAGIETDVETLGLRNATNAAASAGKVLVSLGADGFKTFDSVEDYNKYKEKLNSDYSSATTESEKNRIKREMQLLNEGKMTDFSGLGDADKTAAYLKIMQDAQESAALSEYNLRIGTVESDTTGLSLGELNAVQSRKELEAADPEGYAARQKVYDTLNQQMLDGAQMSPELLQILEETKQKYEQGASEDTQALLAQMKDKQAAQYQLSGDLQSLLDKSRSDYALGGKLDDTVRAEVEQQARAGQAARGNILGNSAAFAEAQEIGKAGEEREQQRYANLLQMAGLEEQLRTASDQQDLANLMNVMNVKTGEEQTNLGNYLNLASTLDQQQYGREQQTLSSLSSFLMGNPVSNQFGALAGAQFGAVGNYIPNLSQVQSYNTGLNSAAGQQSASYSLNNYANQVSYADAQNPWGLVGGLEGLGIGSYLGGTAGGALGASAGTAIGGKLGGMSF
jgi:hypothetical protein